MSGCFHKQYEPLCYFCVAGKNKRMLRKKDIVLHNERFEEQKSQKNSSSAEWLRGWGDNISCGGPI